MNLRLYSELPEFSKIPSLKYFGTPEVTRIYQFATNNQASFQL